MIKHFCDNCGTEIPEEQDLVTEFYLKSRDKKINIKVILSVAKRKNDEDDDWDCFCNKCIKEILIGAEMPKTVSTQGNFHNMPNHATGD